MSPPGGPDGGLLDAGAEKEQRGGYIRVPSGALSTRRRRTARTHTKHTRTDAPEGPRAGALRLPASTWPGPPKCNCLHSRGASSRLQSPCLPRAELPFLTWAVFLFFETRRVSGRRAGAAIYLLERSAHHNHGSGTGPGDGRSVRRRGARAVSCTAECRSRGGEDSPNLRAGRGPRPRPGWAGSTPGRRCHVGGPETAECHSAATANRRLTQSWSCDLAPRLVTWYQSQFEVTVSGQFAWPRHSAAAASQRLWSGGTLKTEVP